MFWINPPDPMDPPATWQRHLRRLDRLDQSLPEVKQAKAEAQREIAEKGLLPEKPVGWQRKASRTS